MPSDVVHRAARRHGKTAAQIFYRYLTQIGVHPLSGTTSAPHMIDDMAVIKAAELDSQLQGVPSIDAQVRGSVQKGDAWELTALECSGISEELGLE